LINEYFNENEVYITKEIIDYFLSFEKCSSAYELYTSGEISEIEEYIKNCKISNDN
jgi:hypothetical protein